MNSPLPFVSRGAKAWGMARRHSPRHPLFRQRWFADDIIITCARWYLRFKLSYRDLAELVRELGVGVAPSTILRWVIDLSATICNRSRPLCSRLSLAQLNHYIFGIQFAVLYLFHNRLTQSPA
jgi:hypothetical protein